MYIAPVLLIAGLGTFFFVYHSDEIPEIASEKNSNTAVSQPHKPAGQSMTIVPHNESASLQTKSPVAFASDSAAHSSIALANQDRDNSKTTVVVKKTTENEQLFKSVGQYNNLELLDKLEEALWNDGESAARDQITAELTERLRKIAEPAVTDRIAELLASNTLSAEQQAYLLSFLGKLGIRNAVDVLTSLIPQLNDGTGKEQLAQIFSNMGDTRWDTDMFAKNPHPLEEAWKNASGDELIKAAVADAIAGIGTTNGIALLLKSLDDDSEYSEETAQAVGNALAKTTNYEAIQFLGETLRGDNSSSRAAYVAAGYALAYNNQEQAVRSLLDWTSNAAEEDSILVEEWLRAAMENNPTAINVIMKESVNKKFDSPNIEAMLSSLRSEYESI
ncbi:MAG: HEAT repeat domain-containing protein [Candidatus Electrothrix sp. AS4_5]|nr:HEAT repeat domain-containing protein [Candidatus Electrothrix gigas]